MAKMVDCTVDTITLSVEQYHFVTKRIQEAGVEDRVTVHNIDFRECLSRAEWKGAFDKFISIEVIEHIGRDFIAEYWGVVDWALKPRTGVGVVQVISLPEARTFSMSKHHGSFSLSF
jgi:cyclopropane-fatty-acyl-phospholipid synthase